MSSNSSHQYMLEKHSSGTGKRLSDIEHLGIFSENFGALFLNEEYSDITLVVEGEKLFAHKVILAARSEYFRAMLFGGMKESSQEEIEMQDAPLNAFKTLLKYIYTGHMFLTSLNEEVILETLGLAHQFGFIELETAISNVLTQLLSLKNVCAIIDTARLFEMEALTKVCLSFFDQNASEILKNESLAHLSQASFVDVLRRDSFFAPEVEIFKGVCFWCEFNEDVDDLVINCLRLPLMSVTDLLSVVRSANIVKPDTLLDAIEERTNTKNSLLPHRGLLLVNENVASQHFGSKVIAGELVEACLDGDIHNYDLEHGYTRHAIGAGDQCIIVKLGKQSIINHIQILLWDKDLRSYSYYIEVSIDLKDWVRVVDYSSYLCRSWQYLHFEKRAVQYIKIVGTNNTVNKVFHLVSFAAMYKESKMPKLYNDIICPKCNVATIEKGASVIEGVSRSRRALLNGDTRNYNLETGYTCHQVGSGSIVIQLAQPYMLSSLRLLLWDCDDRSYSYFIESSVNSLDWDVVVDKSREPCRSWQTIKFHLRPVVFIRIVGTHNTANEVFHCVHFECPSTVDLDEDSDGDKTEPLEVGASAVALHNDAGSENRMNKSNNTSADSQHGQQSTETATEAEESQYAWEDAVD